MPAYDYYCEANGETIEVVHSIDKKIGFWAELCYYAGIPLGDTDPEAPVKRVIRTAPGVSVPHFNSELKNLGFSKLVKRDDGVYENVTKLDHEKKYMKRGDKSSLPDIKSRIKD